MNFSTQGVKEATKEAIKALRSMIGQNNHVLWLVSGGSCIEPEVAILHGLDDDEVARVSILLADERYGAHGHADSNYAKLVAAGFERSNIAFPDILESNPSFEAALERYEQLAEDTMANAGAIFATLGVGPDGHTAGILPGSPAMTDAVSTVIGYTGADFERLTLGFSLLRKIDVAVIFAYGEAKESPLRQLHDHTADASTMASNIFYDIPKVTIYNDSIGSEGTL